jgi:hypothetical protein
MASVAAPSRFRRIYPGVTASLEVVSPARAQRWLDTMHPWNARSPTCTERVARLADVLRETRGLPGDIVFDRRIRLVDGRHRLSAVVVSGLTAELSTLTGWTPAVARSAVFASGSALGAPWLIVSLADSLAALECSYRLEDDAEAANLTTRQRQIVAEELAIMWQGRSSDRLQWLTDSLAVIRREGPEPPLLCRECASLATGPDAVATCVLDAGTCPYMPPEWRER